MDHKFYIGFNKFHGRRKGQRRNTQNYESLFTTGSISVTKTFVRDMTVCSRFYITQQIMCCQAY
jgi:hypothetical protein